ncbi:hypothetical protein CJ030_MR2G019256 [Morella rubra]|uniref:Uncharacterized protein n=1 Tax=Morella rubra TaxID=262757 RepID=A0A6A1WG73_9ROSI|nr:hypothetical protein CJ030_MR2G019256 [Morella rubra]
MCSNIGGDLNQLVAETPQSQMGKKGVVGTGLSMMEEPHGAAVLSSRGPGWTEMAEENRRLLAELAKLKEQGSHMGRGRSTLRSRLNRNKSKPHSILLLIFHSICLPSSS